MFVIFRDNGVEVTVHEFEEDGTLEFEVDVGDGVAYFEIPAKEFAEVLIGNSPLFAKEVSEIAKRAIRKAVGRDNE